LGEQWPSWAPEDIDLDRPSVSRVYDYLLGGAHNFPADRVLAKQILQLDPDARRHAQADRGFLHRAVRLLVRSGVRQFLDLGCGMLTLGSVHEVAQQAAPDARVVYVDIDPVAVVHVERLLRGDDRAAAVLGDLRDPQQILDHPATRRLVDLTMPVGLLLVAVLQHIPDEHEPRRIVAQLRRAVPTGSFLVLSHARQPLSAQAADLAAQVAEVFERAGAPLTLRSRAAIEALCHGWDLIHPGLVDPARWLPEPGTGPQPAAPALAAVGMKP
jgi:SAM-dependent methyltransferase